MLGQGGRPWWRTAVVDEVYLRDLADGDRLGDVPGLVARLPYLADGGYDVADYPHVDPRLGTLADVDALLADAHALGLRVVIDLVANHTSAEHAWFRAALAAAPGSPERARYFFRDGRAGGAELPPDTAAWLSPGRAAGAGR